MFSQWYEIWGGKETFFALKRKNVVVFFSIYSVPWYFSVDRYGGWCFYTIYKSCQVLVRGCWIVMAMRPIFIKCMKRIEPQPHGHLVFNKPFQPLESKIANSYHTLHCNLQGKRLFTKSWILCDWYKINVFCIQSSTELRNVTDMADISV